MSLWLSLAAAQQTGPVPEIPQRTPAQNSAATPDKVQPLTQQPATGAETAPQVPVQAPKAAVPAEGQPLAPTEQGPAVTQSSAAEAPIPESMIEGQLRQLLVGKELYLRGGYLDNSLTFNEHGALIGHSPQGSYTLSGIQIDKMRLTRHKVELTGARYGLHFLGALPYEDPTKALDRVKITPRKKVLKISIDRELVVKPKKPKEKSKTGKVKNAAVEKKGPGGVATAQPAAPVEQPEMSEADQLKASIAAAPAIERPADAKSVTTTTSAAHANKMLKDALERIFAQGLDAGVMAAMPDFWKLYYQAAAAKTDYQPKDPSVLRQKTVDTKARLVSTFEPQSNDYAQNNSVAGMALYHTVIGADGKPGEIAVGRPIGFGLDENAVEAIRKAKFEPAVKDGKPVAVLLDLVVQFRIYSKRTAVSGTPEAEKPDGDKAAVPVLPGPYTLQHP